MYFQAITNFRDILEKWKIYGCTILFLLMSLPFLFKSIKYSSIFFFSIEVHVGKSKQKAIDQEINDCVYSRRRNMMMCTQTCMCAMQQAHGNDLQMRLCTIFGIFILWQHIHIRTMQIYIEASESHQDFAHTVCLVQNIWIIGA